MKILIASRSPNKVAEIRRILGGVDDVELASLRELELEPTPREDGLEPFDTFEENAVSKARHFTERSGIPALADDSGLVVDALDGAPGVRSKRFADALDLEPEARDRANNARLLELLGDTPPGDRTARYVCVAALARPDGAVRTFRGTAEGLILGRPRGDGGFGYDPLFYDRELGRTFAEISTEEKNRRSHRGAAFRAVRDHLERR